MSPAPDIVDLPDNWLVECMRQADLSLRAHELADRCKTEKQLAAMAAALDEMEP